MVSPKGKSTPFFHRWKGCFVILGTLLWMGLAGCGGEGPEGSRETPPLEKAGPPAATSAPPTHPPPAVVTEQTREIYQWYCTQCHGATGKGDGPNASHLAVPPRNHTKADYLETRTDQQLFDAVKLGGLAVGRAPCMPAWGHTLDDEMIHSLVRYIRELCQCEAL